MNDVLHDRGLENGEQPGLASPAPRDRVGPYEVICHLGRGGTANVFEARHVDLGTRVALKVLHSIAGGNHSATRLALREGRAASAIHHPHVVRTVDGGTHHGVPYVVMDLLEGEDLARRLAYRGALRAQEAVDLLLPVISGLGAAHAAGLVHRDLKPSNIFLARRKLGIEPVVVDFGLAKFAEAAEGAATSGIVGTPQYMAPEQVRGLRATPWSDQWSLGVVLYECMTGGSPFWGQDRYELIHSIMTAPVVPPSEVNPEAPRGCAALMPFASEQARHRWTGEFADVEQPAGARGRAWLASGFRSNDVALEVHAPRLVRQSNAQGGFEIGWIGRVVHMRLSGIWDVATAQEFISNMRRVAGELAGCSWAILANSSAFSVQSPEVTQIRQETMALARRQRCEKIAAISASAAYTMQFKRIAVDSHIGWGVFSDEKSALNWIHDRRHQGSKSPPLRAPQAVDPRYIGLQGRDPRAGRAR